MFHHKERTYYDIDRISDLNLYLATEEFKASFVDEIASYASKQEVDVRDLSFLNQYQQHILEHVSLLKASVQKVQAHCDILDSYLKENTLDIQTLLQDDGILRIKETSFYLSYVQGGVRFYVPITEDTYLKKKVYGVLDYTKKRTKWKLSVRMLGLSDKKLDELRVHAPHILDAFEQIENQSSVEETLSHYKTCSKRLFELLNVNESTDLLTFKDDAFGLFFGKEPFELYTELSRKKDNHLIRLQLLPHVEGEVNDDLVALVHNELFLKKNLNEYNEESAFYGELELFERYKEKYVQLKVTLQNKVGVDDERLTTYMSHIKVTDNDVL